VHQTSYLKYLKPNPQTKPLNLNFGNFKKERKSPMNWNEQPILPKRKQQWH